MNTEIKFEELGYIISDNNHLLDEEFTFPIHALYFLGELEAKESLPKILEYLKHDEEIFDYWYSDIFYEDLWEPLYKIGHNNLDELKNFMTTPGISTKSKNIIYRIVEDLALFDTSRRQEAINWYKDIFNHFLNAKIDDNILDSDLIAMMSWSAGELKATELLPEIEELYKRNYATLSIAGDINQIKEIFTEKKDKRKRTLLSMPERYKEIINSWYSNNSEEDKDYKDNNPNTPEPELDHKVSEKKVGRNEPCPCGSGKKYKKCCLNK